MADDHQDGGTEHPPSFKNARAGVVRRIRWRSSDLITASGPEVAETVRRFITSDTLSPSMQTEYGKRVNALLAWLASMRPDIQRLQDVDHDVLAAFIGQVPEAMRAKFQTPIENLFAVLHEHGYAEAITVPRRHRKRRDKNLSLPYLIERGGDEVMAYFDRHLEDRHSGWKELDSSIYPDSLSAMRSLSAWAAGQGIPNIQSVSKGDIILFLKELSSQTARAYTVYLRSFYDDAVRQNVLTANPIPKFRYDESYTDRFIGHILPLAQRAGPDYVAALRRYVDKVPESKAALNSFAQWLGDFETIRDLRGVTQDMIANYRDYEHPQLAARTRRHYQVYIRNFFNALFDEGVITHNPAAAFVQGRTVIATTKPKRVIEPRIYKAILEARAATAQEDELHLVLGKNYGEVNIHEVPYAYRLALADFIRVVGETKKKSGLGNKIDRQVIIHREDIGGNFWDVVSAMNVITMEQGVPHFTDGFIADFNRKDGIQIWAQRLLKEREAYLGYLRERGVMPVRTIHAVP